MLTAHCGESSPSNEASGAKPLDQTPPGTELLPPEVVVMVGGFYLPAGRAVDAHNLVINPDHTYRTLTDGCDFGGSACGSWAEGEGGRLVLFSNLDRRPAYEVVSLDANAVEVRPVGRPGDPERWERGSICAVCGNLGPRALELCNEPSGFGSPDECHSGL